MKARVKATGEIVEVMSVYDDKWYYERIDVCDTKPIQYSADELDFSDIIGYVEEHYDYTPDYWTRLEHQAAIAAMQGVLANADLLFSLCKDRGNTSVKVVAIEFANACAHALVEKMKEERK